MDCFCKILKLIKRSIIFSLALTLVREKWLNGNFLIVNTLTHNHYLIKNYYSVINYTSFSNYQYIKETGLEADRHCLRCLFSVINFTDTISTSPNSNYNFIVEAQSRLLGAQLENQLTRASFISNICFAVDHCFPQQKVCFYREFPFLNKIH